MKKQNAKFGIEFWEKRIVFLNNINSHEAQTTVESAEKEDSEVKAENTEKLAKITTQAQRAIQNESGKALFTGMPSAILTAHPLSATLPQRIIRETQKSILAESKIKSTRYNSIVEATQSRVLGLGTKRVSENLKAYQSQKGVIKALLDERVGDLKDSHGIKTEINEDQVDFEAITNEQGESTALSDIIGRAGKNSMLAIHAKTWNGLSNLDDWSERVSYRLSGAKELKREIKALNKSLLILDEKIKNREEVFNDNKYADRLDELKGGLKSQAKISEKDFNEYSNKMMKTGRMPVELRRRLKETGHEDLIQKLDRAMKLNLLGTLGTRTIREWAGLQRGNIYGRREEVQENKKTAEKTTEVMSKTNGYMKYIQKQIHGEKGYKAGDTITFAYKDGEKEKSMSLEIAKINLPNIGFKNSDGKDITLNLFAHSSISEDGVKVPFLTSLTKNPEFKRGNKEMADENQTSDILQKMYKLPANKNAELEVGDRFKDLLREHGVVNFPIKVFLSAIGNNELTFRNKKDSGNYFTTFKVDTKAGEMIVGGKKYPLGIFSDVKKSEDLAQAA